MSDDIRAGDNLIFTPRMTLVPVSSRLAQAILTRDWARADAAIGSEFLDEWRDDGWQWLSTQAHRCEHDERSTAWGTRLAHATGDQGPDSDRCRVVAEVGFHGPPDHNGVVEIGYRVILGQRRRGLAKEAASALMTWAADQGATRVTASISPDNTASIAVAQKLGFSAGGTYRHPERGAQLRFFTQIAKQA